MSQSENKTICTDMDGVLANIVPEMLRRLNEEYNTAVKESDLVEYDFRVILDKNNVAPGWLRTQFQDDWFWAEAKPYEENIAALQKWTDAGHDIHIVTGRSMDAYIPTTAWLARYDVRYNELYHAQIMHKSEYLSKVNAACLFEDRFYEANKVASLGFRSFVVRRPWTVNYESKVTNPLLSYIDTFSDADDFIDGGFLFNDSDRLADLFPESS